MKVKTIKMKYSTALARGLASNLHQTRLAAAMSMSELATRSGVALGTLSQIETGRGNPTVETLFAIAGAVGTTLGNLLGNPAASGAWVLSSGDGTRIPGSGGVTIRLLDQLRPSPHRVEVYELRFEAKSQHQSSPHPVGTTERILVHTGHLDVTAGVETLVLGPGDFGRFAADVNHKYEAPVATTATLVIEYRRPMLSLY